MRRALLALLLLPLPLLAQDKEGPRSPAELLREFRDAMSQAADDEAALERAGRLFDLSDDLPRADRDRIGQTAAKFLSRFLNRLPEEISKRALRPKRGADEHRIETPDGDLVVVKDSAGVWRFSKETRQEAEALYEKVSEREVRRGTVEYADAETWLLDHIPEWLRRRGFVLQHWQWLGLLALILLGFIAAAIGRGLSMAIGDRAARRRGVKLEKGRKVGRPFGIVAMAALWWFGLGFLSLPERAYTILMVCARLVMMVGVVWSLCRIVDWIAEILAGRARRTATKLDDLLVPMVRKAIKVFVVALGIVWIADNLDMDIAALMAGLGIGGLALALASRDTVENFFGAVAILADRPFQVGDWIRMGDIEGTVEEVGFRSTRVRTFYNSLISFPNAMLIRNSVDNLGERQYRRVKMTLGVTCDTPPDKLESFIEGIRELIRVHPYTRKDYYHVYFHGYGDSGLKVLLYLFVKTPDWATELRERHRLMMDILRLSHELGVEFAFPTRTVHMIRQGMAEHGVPEPSLRKAWQRGQGAAKEIVDRFTGSKVPPPVEIGQRPDDAIGDEE